MAYNPLKLGSLTESKEALSASLYKVNTMLSELYTINNEGDLTAVSQNIVPDQDSVRDLGSPEKQWRSLYVSTDTIYIGGKAVSVSESGTITVDGENIGGNIITSPLTLVGDITQTQALINQLQSLLSSLNSQISSISGQLNSVQTQLNYWFNLLSSTNPSNPQYGYYQSQYFSYSAQYSSLTGNLNALQSQRGQTESLITYHESRLANPNMTLGFNHASEQLEVSGGVKLTKGIILGEGATITDADGTPYITNALPSQTNQAGRYLTTNGNGSLSWASVLPAQTGNANKFLKTDGAGTLTWDTVALSDQELNSTSDVTFNSVTSATDFINTGAGIPTFESATNINLTAANAVVVTTSPFRLANLTTAQRNALSPVNGDMIYNTDDNRFQGFQNGSWINVEEPQNLTSTNSIVSNSITIDLSKSLIEINLTDNVSGIQFTNVPPAGSTASTTIVFTQDGTGSRTVSGTGFLTQSGLGLSVSSAPFSLSVINFVAYGSTIIGFNVGEDYQ